MEGLKYLSGIWGLTFNPHSIKNYCTASEKLPNLCEVEVLVPPYFVISLGK